MKYLSRTIASLLAACSMVLAGCASPPPFQVTMPPFRANCSSNCIVATGMRSTAGSTTTR